MTAPKAVVPGGDSGKHQMPHHVTWAPWVNAIVARDPGLGRIVCEAVVAREAALGSGAGESGASPCCRRAFESAEKTLDTLRVGKIRANTDAARRCASDALRKFMEALDLTASTPSASVSVRRER
jgi:hypothetical protein